MTFTRALSLAWLLPPAFLLAMHLRYALDFPVLDQWEFVPTLRAWQEGDFGIANLIAQHNEHRPALPRAVLLLAASTTGWNLRIESSLTLACACLWFLVLLNRIKIQTNKNNTMLPILALSILVFSAVQWQNWLLGWQFQLVLAVTLATASFALLSYSTLRWTQYVAAVFLACGASLSFANGLLVWPIGLLLIAAHPGVRGRSRLVLASLWTLLAVLLIAGYFSNYTTPPQHGAASDWNAGSAGYTFAYLGAPLFPYHPLGAAVLGGALVWIGIATFMTNSEIPCPGKPTLLPANDPVPRLPRLRSILERGSGFWLALALYAVGSALLTTLARQDQGGMQHALSSRYATISMMFLLALLGEGMRQASAAGKSRYGTLLCLFVVALGLPASAYGAYRWSEHANAYQLARPALLSLEPAPELHWLHPDSALVLERAGWLKAQGWALYRP